MINILWNVIGPVVLSALSIFITFHALQPLALWLDPSFNLLANRGTGKVAFITLVILHIFLLLISSNQQLLKKFYNQCIRFFYNTSWIKKYLQFFSLFFALHAVILISLTLTGYTVYNHEALLLCPSKIASLLFGFSVVFLLAWTEELIFRGMLYQYFAQFWAPFSSALITSIIFSLVHDITQPSNLITTEWKLGLGLFLLGFLLNLIFIVTNKLYCGMGAHAGLVYVKVVLRRLPLISYSSSLPFWLDSDLRKSLLIHFLFIIVITGMLIRYKKVIFKCEK